jgi:hypothetical protein
MLGADKVSFGTSVMIAEGCIMARVCHKNTCPVGVATQDPELRKKFTGTPEMVVRFLTAVAELVNGTIEARRDGELAVRRLKGRSVPYVYGRRLYDVKLTGVEFRRPPGGGASRVPLVHASFETLNRGTGSRTTFELEYAIDGPLAGVPTLIRHKPRWWLEAVLKLEEDGTAPADAKDGRAARPTPPGR